MLHACMDCAGRPRPGPPPARPSDGRRPKRRHASGVAWRRCDAGACLEPGGERLGTDEHRRNESCDRRLWPGHSSWLLRPELLLLRTPWCCSCYSVVAVHWLVAEMVFVGYPTHVLIRATLARLTLQLAKHFKHLLSVMLDLRSRLYLHRLRSYCRSIQSLWMSLGVYARKS